MGSDPAQIPYIGEAGRFLGQSNTERIEQRGEDPGRSSRSFAPPPAGTASPPASRGRTRHRSRRSRSGAIRRSPPERREAPRLGSARARVHGPSIGGAHVPSLPGQPTRGSTRTNGFHKVRPEDPPRLGPQAPRAHSTTRATGRRTRGSLKAPRSARQRRDAQAAGPEWTGRSSAGEFQRFLEVADQGWQEDSDP